MHNYCEIKMNANLSNVGFSRAALVSFLMNENVSLDILNELKTIVSEAVTNAIVHGYLQDESKLVTLTFELNDDILSIIVSDDGVGISDVERARQPLFTTKLSEERAGLGFTIMDIFSDYLEVISTEGVGTKVICKKKIIQEE